MLGGFSVSHDGKMLNERSRRSEKMWLILQYLIYFKGRDIPLGELIAVLWEDEEVENPKSALKTLLHRLRGELVKLGLDEKIILNKRGAYAFNTMLNYSLDTDDFNKTCALAPGSKDIEAEISYVWEAIQLYKGDFLPNQRASAWINAARAHFRELFMKLMKDMIEHLLAENRPHDIFLLCERGLLSNPGNSFLCRTLDRFREDAAYKNNRACGFDEVLADLNG
jgi:two-component SAPR family response regulator